MTRGGLDKGHHTTLRAQGVKWSVQDSLPRSFSTQRNRMYIHTPLRLKKSRPSTPGNRGCVETLHVLFTHGVPCDCFLTNAQI